MFGDPVVERSEARGRPAHSWSRERSNRVLIAFWRGLSLKDAASLIEVSVPTLRKVYFSEVAKRNFARLKGEQLQLERLNDQAAEGNVAAMKELLKQIDRLRMNDQGAAFTARPAKAPKAPKLGKKEQLNHDAIEASGNGEWGSLLKH